MSRKNLNLNTEDFITVDFDDNELPPTFSATIQQSNNLDDSDVEDSKDEKEKNSKKNIELVDPEDLKKSNKDKPTNNKEDKKSNVNKDEDIDDSDDSEYSEYSEDLEDAKNKNNPLDQNKKSSPALVFIKFLTDKGVINLDENDINKISDIIEKEDDEAALEYLFESEVSKRVDTIKNSYEDDVKQYLELREYGISSEIASQLITDKNLIEKIDEKDLSDENSLPLRKQLIKKYLSISTNMNESDIEEYIDTLVDTGKDEQWAKKSLSYIKEYNLKKIQEEKQRIEKEKQEQEKMANEIKETIKKTVFDTKEILGNELTTSMKSKIVKMLTEPAGKDQYGNPIDGVVSWLLKDPLKNRITLAYAIASGVLDGKMTGIKRKVRNDIIEELENAILNKSNIVGGNTNYGPTNSTLESLKNIFGEQ